MAELPRIPGYKIVSKLAEGGMSSVYLAVQEKLDRRVAIKILDPSSLKGKEAAIRFIKEAKTAASLSHSNIIQIMDTGVVEGHHYIIMEYLEESLKERIKRDPQGKIEPETALVIVKEIFKALDYAHFKGIYHRDIKPENIMFKQDNTPVLVDFGIARVFDSADQLTKTGIGMGTVYYMSPEQCNTVKDIDGRSDVYSLGVVLYEMFTGTKPYDAETQVGIAFKHVKDPIPTLPQEISMYQPLIDNMMAKDREKRISNGAEFQELLLSLTPTFHDNFSATAEFKNAQYIEKTGPVPPKDDKIDSTTIRFEKNQFNQEPPHQTPSKKNMLPILAAAGVIIVVLILVLLFTGKKNKSINVGSDTSSSEQTAEQQAKETETQFQAKYKLAEKAIELRKLDEAERLVKLLKKLKPGETLFELKEKIKELNEEFEAYMNNAREFFKAQDFQKAQISIMEAKKLKITGETKILEESINAYLDKK